MMPKMVTPDWALATVHAQSAARAVKVFFKVVSSSIEVWNGEQCLGLKSGFLGQDWPVGVNRSNELGATGQAMQTRHKA